jgi:hypothetical protein
MVRGAVLSIVLTLAVGPEAALLCRARCHPQAADASACHDEKQVSSSSVGADATCDHVVLNIAAYLREDVRRGVSAPDTSHTLPVTRYQLAPSTTHPRAGKEPGREWSLEKRTLATALRI